jgi:hypothetical protein
MTVAQLALHYDPAQFTVSAVQMGSVPLSGTGWNLQAVVDQSTGQIGIALASLTPIASSTGGSLVTISLHEKSTPTPGATALQLVATVSPNGRVFSTVVDDNQGPFTLTPAPANAEPVPGMAALVALPAAKIGALTPVGPSVDEQISLPDEMAFSDVILTAPELTFAAQQVVPETTSITTSDPVMEQPPSVTGALLMAEVLATSTLANAAAARFALFANVEQFVAAQGNLPLNVNNLCLQRAADQVFQALAAGAVAKSLESLPRDRALAESDWLDGGQSLPRELKASTDIDALDGCFAQTIEANSPDCD